MDRLSKEFERARKEAAEAKAKAERDAALAEYVKRPEVDLEMKRLWTGVLEAYAEDGAEVVNQDILDLCERDPKANRLFNLLDAWLKSPD